MHCHRIYKVALIFCISLAPFRYARAQADSTRNKYLSELKTTTTPFVDSLREHYVHWYALPEKVFLAKMDSARTLFLGVLNKYAVGFKPDYSKEQRQQIDYYMDKLLIDYPGNFYSYTGQPFPYESIITQRLKYNLPDLNNPKMLNNVAFRNYTHSFFNFQLIYELKKPKYQGVDNRRLNAVFNLISKYITNTKCRNFWQYDYLYNHINSAGIKNIDKIYRRFMASCKDTIYTSRVATIYQQDFKGRQGHLIKTYKTVGTYKLDLHLFLPDSAANGKKRPVMVYFHAGSWMEGKPDWFFGACKTDARNGWVACAVEYRLYDREGTLPFEAVKDARSVIRWLRQHAAEYNIDTNRVVVSGYSAGGQLALACALADKYNEPTDDLHFSPVPNLIMVTSAVYDLTDINNSWVRRDLKDKDLVKEISPNYLVKGPLPPTLIIHGIKDNDSPYASARLFESEMLKHGRGPELHSMKGAGHFLWLDPTYIAPVDRIQKAFLKKNGY